MSTPEEKIEKTLGRKLRPEDEGGIPYLNQFPPDLLAEARRIARESKILAFRFVKFYYGPGQSDEVKAFIDDVVVGAQEPTQWQRWDRLYAADAPFPKVLGMSVEDILAPLEDAPGERWVRLVPSRSMWTRSSFCGRPCIVHRGSDYEWRPPTEVSRLLLHEYESLETVDDVTIGMRRWIASRVAWQLMRKQIELTPSAGVNEVTRMLSADASPSPDADFAIRALLREERELGPSSDAVPGFRGPDEWYTA